MFVAEAVFIAMVAIGPSLQNARSLLSAGHAMRKALGMPFNGIEKTELTRAAKIAAEWPSAELRHLAQPVRRLLREHRQLKEQNGGRSKPD
jgi:hypothetical protein